MSRAMCTGQRADSFRGLILMKIRLTRTTPHAEKGFNPVEVTTGPRFFKAPAESPGNQKRATLAFTLMEVMMAVIVVSVVFFTVYAGFTFGFVVVQVNRENVRATQILQEKMEMVRLYSWDQVTNHWIPTSFTEYFDPIGGATNC